MYATFDRLKKKNYFSPGGQIHVNFLAVLLTLQNFTDKKDLTEENFSGSMPLVTPNYKF